MKKIIIGIVIVILLAAIVAGVISWRGSGSGSSSDTASNSDSAQNTAASNASSLNKIYQMPTSTMLTLGTSHGSVTMKNFYLSSAGAESQLIVLAAENNYEIAYDPSLNKFYLYIGVAPYDANRTAAETDFLARLGVSKADACKLNVSEEFGNRGTAMLSFCNATVIQ